MPLGVIEYRLPVALQLNRGFNSVAFQSNENEAGGDPFSAVLLIHSIPPSIHPIPFSPFLISNAHVSQSPLAKGPNGSSSTTLPPCSHPPLFPATP